MLVFSFTVKSSKKLACDIFDLIFTRMPGEITKGDSGLCCVFATSFQLHSTLLCVDFVYSDLVHNASDTQSKVISFLAEVSVFYTYIPKYWIFDFCDTSHFKMAIALAFSCMYNLRVS